MSTTNLMAASAQWAKRPNDERFWNLQEAYTATREHKNSAREAKTQLKNLSVEVNPETQELQLVSKSNTAKFTHYSFGQLCQKVSAPADYLRDLKPSLAAECLSEGLGLSTFEGNLLLNADNGLRLRCVTSEKYSRIWNSDVIERLLDILPAGWRVPPARPATSNDSRTRIATEQDVLVNRNHALSVNIGDMISPAGVYASDHDMFVFLVNENRTIDDGTPEGMSRGVIVSNSEVGAAAFKVTMFYYMSVCGNHIIWNASDIQTVRVIHKGTANDRYVLELEQAIDSAQNSSGYADSMRIKTAKTIMIGKDKNEVLDTLFGKRILPYKTLESAYDYSVIERDTYRPDTDPRSVWGMVNGLTRLSQDTGFTDKRFAIDSAASKILQMAF